MVPLDAATPVTHPVTERAAEARGCARSPRADPRADRHTGAVPPSDDSATAAHRWLGVTMLWVTRLVWIVVGVAGWAMFDGLGLDGAPAAGVAAIAAATWVAGVVGLSVPSVLTLTIARVAVPAAVIALGAIAWASDDPSTLDVASGMIASLVATVIVAQPEFGRWYVQASAYGREDRHLLRAPPGYLVAASTAWSIVMASGSGAAVALAREVWWLGGVLGVAMVAIGAFSWPRWHRLSRRWFVLLPSGVVVHDHLVLADTVMIPARDVAGLRLAPAETEAADLTGPAGGHAVEVLPSRPVTAVRASSPSEPRGSALHFTACLVAPTRPGRALAAARAYRLPVG